MSTSASRTAGSRPRRRAATLATGHCPHTTTLRLPSIACTVAQQVALATYADVTIKQPTSGATSSTTSPSASRSFAASQVQQVSITHYPDNDLAAQVLGVVGQVTESELREKDFKGVNHNAVVGQTGLEREYDEYLRGKFGKQQIDVDSSGRADGRGQDRLAEGRPQPRDLAGRQAPAGRPAVAGAVDGRQRRRRRRVRGHGPRQRPGLRDGVEPHLRSQLVFSPALSVAHAKHLNSVAANDPEFNRAYQAHGPDGSTFKVITATGALESGDWLSRSDLRRHRHVRRRHRRRAPVQNSGGAAYGDVNLESAIKVSDDIFFYHLGALTNVDPQPIPRAVRCRSGRASCSGSAAGPASTCRARLAGHCSPAGVAREPQQGGASARTRPAATAIRYVEGRSAMPSSATSAKGCSSRSAKGPVAAASADGTDPWTVGDNVKPRRRPGRRPGDAAAAGRRLLGDRQRRHDRQAPHRRGDHRTPTGRCCRRSPPGRAQAEHQPGSIWSTIQEGLHEAAQTPGGTSDDVMGSLGQQVYGKTGTAQYIPTSGPRPDRDRLRLVLDRYVPATATSKPIEVVVWVEKGRLRRRRRRAGRPPDHVGVVLRQARPLHFRLVDRSRDRAAT